MIYKHRHLKDVFLEGKTIKAITQQCPLVFVVEQNQFLHYTISTCMKYYNIAHVITPLSASNLQGNRKNMGHEVPTLIFANEVLQTEQLVQLICDACIQDNEFIDFQARKLVVKELVRTWREIFIFEKSKSYNFSSLKSIGISNRKGYENLIFQLLQNLSTYFKGKMIQKAFSGYSAQKLNIQDIIYIDIIDSILNGAAQSYADYALRAYYQHLIEIRNQLKQLIKNIPACLRHNHEIVLDAVEVPEKNNWENWRLNHYKFAFVFGFMSTMFAIFVKP